MGLFKFISSLWAKWFGPKPKAIVLPPPLHPLITLVLDLVRADHLPCSDPWILQHDKEDDQGRSNKWLYLNRTASDRLYLRNTGALCITHKMNDDWKCDHIILTSSEVETLKGAYDEIMRKRAIKIVEYRSPEKPVIEELCS